ncbi:MAG: serine/threonine-protein kinase [Gemmatimonadales bacterium]
MTDQLDSLREALRGRYDPVREVGRGGMATVYLAQDVKHNRPVAVKVLRPELAASIAVNRFLKEIQIAAQLNHPHIVPLLDSGDVNGVLHFVMPFVAGHSVRGLLDGARPITLATALEITSEVADALSYAHRKGLVHRDIKPENILLSEGHAVVADFGIAKAISTAGGDKLTRTGFPIGTVGYMSPEQAAGRTDLDERTDVYSLASVFYEMMVGQAPGMWVTDDSMKYKRFMDALPAHRERLDRLPGAVEQELVRAMSMHPEQRHTTPNNFAAALELAVRRKPAYDEAQVRDVIRYASERQVEHPTEEGALSLAAIQRIGAEVGLSPDRVRDAVQALAKPPAVPARGGIFGAPSKIDMERTLDAELPVEAFEALLEEVRGVTGEVGRINETLGRSLSWNSLSFQNSLEGTGRLIHVMVKPKDGKTRIRITESAGVHPMFLGFGTVMGGGMLAGVISGAVLSAGAPFLLTAAIFGVTWGATYVAARTLFRGFIRRRVRILSDLLDRLSNHVTATAPYSAVTVTGSDAEPGRLSPGQPAGDTLSGS